MGELKAELNIAQTDIENYNRRDQVGGHSERNNLPSESLVESITTPRDRPGTNQFLVDNLFIPWSYLCPLLPYFWTISLKCYMQTKLSPTCIHTP